MTLLRTDNLTKNYDHFCALDKLNLTLKPGEIFGLLGPNGSGKSTAIRLILGLLKPTAGAAWVNGHNCWHDGVAARRHVAYLPGELRLYENMTGWRLIEFLNSLRGRFDRRAVAELASEFDIDLTRPVANLSSGMKRKLALAQVLTARTPLLILDEPTNTLDPTMRDALLLQLRRARDRGQTVLFSSHVLSEVEQVCDRVGILRRGHLVHEETLAESRRSRRLCVRLAQLPSQLPRLDGVTHVDRRGDQLVLDIDGALAPVLEWLAVQDVRDLAMESTGLEAVYRRYYGDNS